MLFPARCFECGSRDFVVEYRTVARLTINREGPVRISYAAPSGDDLFATTACAECEAFLDIDGSWRSTQFPGILGMVRDAADRLATSYPSLTVIAMRPDASPRMRAD